MRQHVLQIVGMSAPPRPGRRQEQLLVQETAAHLGQERGHGGGLDDPRTERIRHRDVAGTNSVHQAGDAECRIGPQLQRIAKAVVEPAENHVHLTQPFEGLDEDAAVADGQVGPFDQREAEVPRQIRVLEVGFVERPGSQQHHARMIAPARWRQGHQSVAIGPEECAEPLHATVAEGLRQAARQHDSILQRVAGAGRRLCAVSDHPPLTIRRSGHVHREQVHVQVVRYADAVTRPEKRRVREHQ